MSELLSKLCKAEMLRMKEINDLEYMSDKLDTWLDNGLINDNEFFKLQEELGI